MIYLFIYFVNWVCHTYMSMHAYLCSSMCLWMQLPMESRRDYQSPLELGLQAPMSCLGCLEPNSIFCKSSTCSLECWDISSTPVIFFSVIANFVAFCFVLFNLFVPGPPFIVQAFNPLVSVCQVLTFQARCHHAWLWFCAVTVACCILIRIVYVWLFLS